MSTNSSFENNGPSFVGHHWVGASRQFQTNLLLRSVNGAENGAGAPEGQPPALELKSSEHRLDLTLFDFDGVIISQAVLEMPRRGISLFELEPFFGGCRRESGLPHGHLRLESAEPFSSLVRLQSESFCSEMGGLRRVNDEALAFFPLMFQAGRSASLVMVNPMEREAHVRCRLFIQNRAPDLDFTIAPRGARLVVIPIEYAEYLKSNAIQNSVRGVPGYIRVAARQGSIVFTQLVEEVMMPVVAPALGLPVAGSGIRTASDRVVVERAQVAVPRSIGELDGQTTEPSAAAPKFGIDNPVAFSSVL